MIEAGPVTVRAARAADRDAVGSWIGAALDFDDDAVALLEMLWDAADPELRVIASGPDGPIGVALGSIRAATGGGHVDLIAVVPWMRERGVGSELLSAVEQRLRSAGATALSLGGNTPMFAWPGIDIRYTPALCMAAGRGYTYAREALNMTVDLRQAPLDTASDEARLRAGGVHVRRLRSAELEQFDPWVREWGGTWHIEAARAAAYATPRVHVAVRDGNYVGFACHGVNRTPWFGPMGTADSERGQGVGAVLLRRCLADLRDTGLRTAEIAWVGPHKFYARAVGAVLARAFWIYRKDC